MKINQLSQIFFIISKENKKYSPIDCFYNK